MTSPFGLTVVRRLLVRVLLRAGRRSRAAYVWRRFLYCCNLGVCASVPCLLRLFFVRTIAPEPSLALRTCDVDFSLLMQSCCDSLLCCLPSASLASAASSSLLLCCCASHEYGASCSRRICSRSMMVAVASIIFADSDLALPFLL